MRSKKIRPTKKPSPGYEWIECRTCDGAGEIIGHWSTTLGGERIRCPRCFDLGWVEGHIDEPPKQGQVVREASSDDKESLKGRGKPGTEHTSSWATPMETIDWDALERTLKEERSEAARRSRAAKERNRSARRRASKERSKRILGFLLVAGLIALAGAVVGVLLIFPLLPDAVADLVVDLKQHVQELSGP